MSKLFLALPMIMLVSNCEKESIKQEEAKADQVKLKNTVTLKTDIENGRMVYFANCVSCHNNNPKKPGSIGPELYGVSIDTLTQKIIYGKYPENFRPKRKSKIMPLMPHLNKKISNLHMFINDF
tara:strand:+ start:78 stop:449 length:372 start_codon:yes stop_codon:yes gene_type:complete